MNRPTVLRNSAEPEIVIGIALKIFYNADDWIDNSFFLDELDREYDSIGKTRESRTWTTIRPTVIQTISGLYAKSVILRMMRRCMLRMQLKPEH